MAIPAEVVQIVGKLGIKGVSRVKCKIIEGKGKVESQKFLTRNVVGPVKVGDIILLKETEMEAESKLQGR